MKKMLTGTLQITITVDYEDSDFDHEKFDAMSTEDIMDHIKNCLNKDCEQDGIVFDVLDVDTAWSSSV